MDPHSLKKLNAARSERKAAILLTDITGEAAGGRDRVIVEGDVVAGDLGEAVVTCFKTGKSKTFSMGDVEFFLNVYLPAPKIYVIGAVHISQALAEIAMIAGNEIKIIDPRTAFATEDRFSGVELHSEWPEEVFKTQLLDAYCALVAVTHDPKIDDLPIIEAIKHNCFYVGALGSRKTHGARLDRLGEAGLSQQELQNIHAPIGLDIGASSPQEIAVAIMAEIIETFRKRDLDMRP